MNTDGNSDDMAAENVVFGSKPFVKCHMRGIPWQTRLGSFTQDDGRIVEKKLGAGAVFEC